MEWPCIERFSHFPHASLPPTLTPNNGQSFRPPMLPSQPPKTSYTRFCSLTQVNIVKISSQTFTCWNEGRFFTSSHHLSCKQFLPADLYNNATSIYYVSTIGNRTILFLISGGIFQKYLGPLKAFRFLYQITIFRGCTVITKLRSRNINSIESLYVKYQERGRKCPLAL